MRKARTNKKARAYVERRRRKEEKKAAKGKNTSSYKPHVPFGRSTPLAPPGCANRFDPRSRQMSTHMGSVSRYGKENPEKMQALFDVCFQAMKPSNPEHFIKALNRSNITLEYYQPQKPQKNNYVADISARENMIYINPDKPVEQQAVGLAQALIKVLDKKDSFERSDDMRVAAHNVIKNLEKYYSENQSDTNIYEILAIKEPFRYYHNTQRGSGGQDFKNDETIQSFVTEALVARDKHEGFKNTAVEIYAHTTKKVENDFRYDKKGITDSFVTLGL